MIEPVVIGPCTIHAGDCRDVLPTLADGSVNCCVTSPPYFGLRNYNVDRQIGLEPTPDEYVGEMVNVFREVRRILADDGTCWLNLGDSYSSGGGIGGSGYNDGRANREHRGRAPAVDGLKAKDLIGIPWRVAFALQADGWYLRQDIIWSKPNPMPESVKDRCTKAHEYVFLLTKSARYWYDADAIREKLISNGRGGFSNKSTSKYTAGAGPGGKPLASMVDAVVNPAGRNVRSVWSISPQPFSGAHFATMPPTLAERCILAGCPEGGTVLDPFTGAGTTAVVAVKHGRRFVGSELNETYLRDIITPRIRAAVAAEKSSLFPAGTP